MTDCPLTTDTGVTVSVAVKLPMVTVFEFTLFDLAVTAEFVARAVKYTEPVMSALYFHCMVLVCPAVRLNWSREYTDAPLECVAAVVELQPRVAPVRVVAVLPV